MERMRGASAHEAIFVYGHLVRPASPHKGFEGLDEGAQSTHSGQVELCWQPHPQKFAKVVVLGGHAKSTTSHLPGFVDT